MGEADSISLPRLDGWVLAARLLVPSSLFLWLAFLQDQSWTGRRIVVPLPFVCGAVLYSLHAPRHLFPGDARQRRGHRIFGLSFAVWGTVIGMGCLTGALGMVHTLILMSVLGVRIPDWRLHAWLFFLPLISAVPVGLLDAASLRLGFGEARTVTSQVAFVVVWNVLLAWVLWSLTPTLERDGLKPRVRATVSREKH